MNLLYFSHLLRTLYCTLLSCASLCLVNPSHPVEADRTAAPRQNILYQFPVGTWREDMAVREDGKILTTSLTTPELLDVDMQVNPVKVVHTFDDQSRYTGIYGSPTLMDKEVFYVIAGDMSLNSFSFGPVQGSWSRLQGHTAPPSSPH